FFTPSCTIHPGDSFEATRMAPESSRSIASSTAAAIAGSVSAASPSQAASMRSRSWSVLIMSPLFSFGALTRTTPGGLPPATSPLVEGEAAQRVEGAHQAGDLDPLVGAVGVRGRARTVVHRGDAVLGELRDR